MATNLKMAMGFVKKSVNKGTFSVIRTLNLGQIHFMMLCVIKYI